jgi:hypothetical protein
VSDVGGITLVAPGSSGAVGVTDNLVGGTDVTGDGVPDLAVGSPYDDAIGAPDAGMVYVVAGPITTSGPMTASHAIITGDRASEWVGELVVMPGDINDDGVADLVFSGSSTRPDGVAVRYGPIASGSSTTADAVIWYPGAFDAGLPMTIAGGGDVTGDACPT